MLNEHDARGLGFISGIFADFFRRLEESHDAYVKNHKSWDDIAYKNMQAVFRGESIGVQSDGYSYNSMKDTSKQAKFLSSMSNGSAMADEINAEARSRQKRATRFNLLNAGLAAYDNMTKSKAEATTPAVTMEDKHAKASAEKTETKSSEEVREARLKKYSSDIAMADAIKMKATASKAPALEA